MGESDPACCKVGAAIDRYSLGEGFNQRLIDRWTGTDRPEAEGYRPLTDWFNRRLMKHAFDRNGLDTTGVRIDREYRALTGSDHLAGEEVRMSLTDSGLDVDTLERSFVSWSTMKRHLTDCLEAEKELPEAQTEWERNSIAIARGQLEAKVDAALSSLHSKGELPGGTDATIAVTVELTCPECHLRVPLETALDRGHICPDHDIAGNSDDH